MKNTKKPAKFPAKWAGSVDDFDFNPGGRPAQTGPQSKSKPASKKDALKEALKHVLGEP